MKGVNLKFENCEANEENMERLVKEGRGEVIIYQGDAIRRYLPQSRLYIRRDTVKTLILTCGLKRFSVPNDYVCAPFGYRPPHLL